MVVVKYHAKFYPLFVELNNRFQPDSFSGLEKSLSVRKRSLLTLGIRPFHTSFIYFYFLRR